MRSSADGTFQGKHNLKEEGPPHALCLNLCEKLPFSILIAALILFPSFLTMALITWVQDNC